MGMKVSEILRQAQAGTVDAQVRFLGEFAISEVSKLFQALGAAQGDAKFYVIKADFRSWKAAAERVFADLKAFTEAEGVGESAVPDGYKVGAPPT